MNRSPLYLLVAVLASCVITGVIAIVIARAGQRESERKLCGFITIQDDIYRATPPTTPTGRRVAAGLAELRRAYEC